MVYGWVHTQDLRRRRRRRYKRAMRGKGKLAKYVSRKVYRAINTNLEKKFIDVNLVATGVLNTVTFQRLTSTILGTGDSLQRIGDKIRLYNLQCRMNMIAGDINNRFRITIFRWMEDDTFNPPTATQVYSDPVSNCQSFFNMDTLKAGKMKVIYDKVIDVEQGLNAQVMIKLFKKLSSFVKYNGGGQTGTGHLYLAYQSDSGVSPNPTLEYNIRVVFKDG